MRIHEHDFENQDVVLDFHEFDHCTFTNCKMILHGVGPYHLSDSNMLNCSWEFTGPAALTIEAITKMYHDGSKEMIETMFENIRLGNNPGSTELNTLYGPL